MRRDKSAKSITQGVPGCVDLHMLGVNMWITYQNKKKNYNKTYQYFLWIFLYGLINALVVEELSYLLFGSENIKLTAAFENFDNI